MDLLLHSERDQQTLVRLLTARFNISLWKLHTKTYFLYILIRKRTQNCKKLTLFEHIFSLVFLRALYVYSCISLIKVWPQKCLFLGFLTCLEWQYHNNNLAWWGFLLRKSSTFFSSLPSLSPPDIWLLSIARQEKCLFENRSIIIKNLVVECNECFACLYESRKKLQIGSFLERER